MVNNPAQSILIRSVADLVTHKLGPSANGLDLETLETIVKNNSVLQDDDGIVDFDNILIQTNSYLKLINGRNHKI